MAWASLFLFFIFKLSIEARGKKIRDLVIIVITARLVKNPAQEKYLLLL